MMSLYLSGEGFQVTRAETAQDGMEKMKAIQPEMILLDLMLPDSDGIDTCSTIREQTNAPIIVVSLNDSVTDRIHALQSGADDYLCKPFSMQELKARIEVVLRRMSRYSAELPQPAPRTEVNINLDDDRRLLLVHGEPVETTYTEWELLKLFVSNPGKVFPRESLIQALRGVDSYVNDRAVDVHIMNLRKKMGDDRKQPRFIKTVWGVGYKFSANE